MRVYRGYRDSELLGYAFIDVHQVRTLPEAFLVVLSPEGRVRSLRVVAFHEPLEYMPGGRWYEQFEGKTVTINKKTYPICTNMILGVNGASLGVGLGLTASAGSTLVTVGLKVMPRPPGGSRRTSRPPPTTSFPSIFLMKGFHSAYRSKSVRGL